MNDGLDVVPIRSILNAIDCTTSSEVAFAHALKLALGRGGR
jgi:hypothetical protein